MPYEFKREDAFSFADYIGAQYHEKGDELHFEYCPRCGGGGHGDRDTFSINLVSGAFNCLRSSCDYHGHFVELCRDFDYKLDFGVPKIYKRLRQPDEPIKPNDEAVRYMQSRGISPETTTRFEITSRKDNRSVLVFPFYDDQGTLTFLKYRNTKPKPKQPKEWCEVNTMPILFGMKQARAFDQPLTITEGQLDSLSLAEAGIPNAVSVPTGANGFTWLTPCYDWVCKFSCVIVFGDYENGKITLLDTLKARLPMVVKAVRKQDYLGEKDANAILQKYGTNALRIAVENAEVPKLENVKDLASVESVDMDKIDKIPTGILDLDKTIGGMCVGQVVLLTGKRGEGKSTFGSQLIANALDANESVFIYSGELAAFHAKRWLDYQLAGAENITVSHNIFGQKIYNIAEETVHKISEWYRGRAYIYDNDYLPDGKSEYESLPETIEKVIRQYGTRFVFIDNLMTAMDAVTDKDNLYLAQSNFVGTLKKIAMKYNVVILLVAHPRKSNTAFSNDDVSGSSDITNKVDVVLSYGRAEPGAEWDSVLQVSKNRLWGKLRMGVPDLKNDDGGIVLNYSESTKRIVGRYDRIRHYGWEKQESIADDDLPFD